MTADRAFQTVPISISAFPAQDHAFLVHCQTGYDTYVSSVLQSTGIETGRQFWAAADVQGLAIGFAEYRRLSEGYHLLNHIAVKPSAQGKGIGRSLISNYLAQPDVAGIIALDAFLDRDAHEFYSAIGFRVKERRTWYILPAASIYPASPPKAYSQDRHVLDACLDAYGFGKVTIVLGGGREVELGFPSRAVVRLPSISDLTDDMLLSAVRANFPLVATFVVIQEGQQDARVPDATARREAVRMAAPMEVVRCSFEEQVEVEQQ